MIEQESQEISVLSSPALRRVHKTLINEWGRVLLESVNFTLPTNERKHRESLAEKLAKFGGQVTVELRKRGEFNRR